MNEINELKTSAPVNAYYEKSLERSGLGHHFHCYHELILVREGSAEFKINGISMTAEADSLVVISDLEQHERVMKAVPYNRYVLTITTDLCLLAISEPILLSLLMQRPENFNHVIPLGPKLAERLSRCFQKAARECEQKEVFWETRAAMLVTETLLLLYRDKSSVFPGQKDTQTVQIVLQVQQDIARNYRDKITLEELAKKYFISQYYLSRVFKELTGYGFKEYLILYRINEAKKLLSYTKLPVTEVCFACGYQNSDHFIRIFRENQGCSPLQYRKKFKALKDNFSIPQHQP
jgi:AraC-like DNA-binding protein